MTALLLAVALLGALFAGPFWMNYALTEEKRRREWDARRREQQARREGKE